MTTDPLPSCRHCGDPLPPHKGRGRPPLAHAGECQRIANNKARMHGRAQRFLADIDLPPIDRSDGTLPGAVSRADVDGDELYNETGALSGYSETPAPWRPIYENEEFLEKMQEYEEEQAARAQLNKYVSKIDPELRRKVALIPPIGYDAYMEILRRNPEARPSPAFEYYVEHREELDEAADELFRQLFELDEAARAARRRKKTPA